MAKEVRWTDEAITTFNNIIGYIQAEWSEKAVREFIQKTDEVVTHVAVYPYMFKKYNKHSIRQALITKQTLLLYKIYTTHIDLVAFWDTRQNPRRKKMA